MERLWKYYRRYWTRWTWGCVMLLLTNGVTMLIPQLFRFAVDGIEGGMAVGHLRGIALTLVLLALAGAAFRVLSRVHVFYAGRDVEMDLRVDFYAHLTRQQPSFFRQQTTGDLLSRATADLTQVRLMLGPGVLNIVNTLIAYAVAVPVMVTISPRLTLLSLACFPPALLVMRQLGRILYHANRRVRESAGEISNLVQENLAGAHVVRAFANEAHQRRAFEERNQAYYAANVRLSWSRSGLFRLGLTMANVAILVGLFFGSRDILAGELTTGELVALVEYMALLSWPTLALGWILSMWQRGSAAMWRINEIFDTPPTIIPGAVRPDALLATFTTRDLTVELGGRRVLDGVSFTVAEGSTVGVVGTIGSGKTILVQSLVRLVEVAPGQVFLDGVDVTELDLDTLRGAFGYVPQDHVLFSRSLEQNVAFGRPEASRDQVLEALASAAFAPDLDILPEGVETPVGERGLTLSGGQKQRASIARALLLDPPILLLDDALSSLDSETEAEILAELRRARVGRTTLIVSHRVSAVQQADQILVLHDGRIVESGTHDDLVAKTGTYAAMVRRQEIERNLAAGSGAAGVLR
jgi:ATP-binding cassette subfamily B protein